MKRERVKGKKQIKLGCFRHEKSLTKKSKKVLQKVGQKRVTKKCDLR